MLVKGATGLKVAELTMNNHFGENQTLASNHIHVSYVYVTQLNQIW